MAGQNYYKLLKCTRLYVKNLSFILHMSEKSSTFAGRKNY